MNTQPEVIDIDNPVIRQPEYWGQINIDVYYAVLEKGVGKTPFNAQIHSADKRVTAIDFKLAPLAEMNAQYTIDRGMIAESREYAAIVLPSIKALGITAREFNGKWVKMEFVETGRTYTDKHGETKNSTTIKFMALFADENACRADYLAAHTAGTSLPADVTAAPWADPAPAAPAPVDDKARKTAQTFLKVYVDKAVKENQGNIDGVMNALAGYLSNAPIVNKYFTVDSVETMTLIAEAMSK